MSVIVCFPSDAAPGDTDTAGETLGAAEAAGAEAEGDAAGDGEPAPCAASPAQPENSPSSRTRQITADRIP